MQISNIPAKFSIPFANSGSKNTIPVASQIGVTPGAASLTDGFPPLTMTPLSAGGVNPAGKDFNGILNWLSSVSQYAGAGGMYPYDAAFSTDIGGYPQGAVLLKADFSGLWISTADNNTTNPDTGGAGWMSALSGRLLNIRVITESATYTASPGTTYVIVEAQGGGGGSGGCPATDASHISLSLGGYSGSYGRGRYTSGFSGVAITIGAAGLAGAAGTSGSPGGTTSFGALLSCPGGAGGVVGGTGGGIPSNTFATLTGSAAPSGANLLSFGGGVPLDGVWANASGGGPPMISRGARSFFGEAGAPGSGGNGVYVASSQAAAAGLPGYAGLVIVWEYA